MCQCHSGPEETAVKNKNGIELLTELQILLIKKPTEKSPIRSIKFHCGLFFMKIQPARRDQTFDQMKRSV